VAARSTIAGRSTSSSIRTIPTASSSGKARISTAPPIAISIRSPHRTAAAWARSRTVTTAGSSAPGFPV
jgi:hypothetical protein